MLYVSLVSWFWWVITFQQKSAPMALVLSIAQLWSSILTGRWRWIDHKVLSVVE
jgi:hypothetical protein